MSSLTIAVAQFAPTTDVAENLRTIVGYAEHAAASGADLLVTPEYSSYFAADLGPDFVAAAEPLDGAFVAGLRDAAREHGIALVVGLVERIGDGARDAAAGRFRNTLVAIGPDGALLETYRKVHLYDAFGARESDWIEPGDPSQLAVFALGGVRVGLQTCYDLRFPEVTRRLADPARGAADVVLLPAEWVRGPGKEHHWRTLVTARAIENTVWVAASGVTPPIGVGASTVVDPSGTAVAALGAQPGVLLATVDTDETARVRAVNPSLTLGRYAVAEP